VLTFKPQLGVLIPIAYLAGGHWKAIAYAAGTTILLVAASYFAFGGEAWQAFFDSLRSVSEGVQKSEYPIHKMPTMFAACRLSGVPVESAMIAQYLAMGVAALVVAWSWYKSRSVELAAAVLCGAVFLCSPYAYYYDMTLLVLPAIVLVRYALKSGWLAGEEIVLTLVWFAPLAIPGPYKNYGSQLGLAVILLLLVFSLRRCYPFAVGVFPQACLGRKISPDFPNRMIRENQI